MSRALRADDTEHGVSVTEADRTSIRVGAILPRLALAGNDGPSSLTLPANRALLLVVLHPGGCTGCSTYLTEVAGIVDDLRDWGTRVVVVGVVSSAPCDDELPFPLLGDEGGARDRLGLGDDAAVILADRWGEVMEVGTVGADHDFPLPAHLVESAKIVDLSCGECNVPSAEWREAER